MLIGDEHVATGGVGAVVAAGCYYTSKCHNVYYRLTGDVGWWTSLPGCDPRLWPQVATL